MSSTPTGLPVMVLAHNEERHIAACLDSIFSADPDLCFDVYVMANGCTDRTADIVRQYGYTKPHVHLITIPVGDKCNAWNVFVHETVPTQCPHREAYVFMDGDARAVPGSFSVMLRALRSHPHANAASAVPASGRNIRHDREGILRSRGLVANLYALRGSFVDRLRENSVRIPLGLEGDDGLIGALIKWDLHPERQGFDHQRIVPCSEAGFEVETLSPARLAHWAMYWKRAVRYGRRRYEFQLLGRRLKAHGIAGLPADIREAYEESHELELIWDGLYTLPNWVALRQVRSMGKARDSGRLAACKSDGPYA
jgi:glycosyltransferase involved in cell wall biosynthesis